MGASEAKSVAGAAGLTETEVAEPRARGEGNAPPAPTTRTGPLRRPGPAIVRAALFLVVCDLLLVVVVVPPRTDRRPLLLVAALGLLFVAIVLTPARVVFALSPTGVVELTMIAVGTLVWAAVAARNAAPATRAAVPLAAGNSGQLVSTA